MDDADKTTVAAKVKGWRDAVAIGDVTRAYAAEQIAGDITYPYATAARFSELRDYAHKLLPRGR